MIEAIRIGRRAGDCWLLSDVSLTISPGERLAIVGPTGSGKTLLLRSLARLDPTDTGEICWRGQPVRGELIPEFRAQVMYLHQRPALLEGTVEDNLRFPFTLRHQQQRSFSPDSIQMLLKQISRNDTFLEREIRDLSGGEAQMVALLRAIQLQPSVLLLDEPTSALDDESSRNIEQLVLGWFGSASAERAFVWVSHNHQQVARVAHRVMVMHDGRLTDQADGNTESSA